VPEGDTIFRSARALQQGLAGHQVAVFETAYAPLASVHDQSPVIGRVIEQVESRGKWLLMHFSGDLILATHMLMSGSWHIYRVGERWRRPRSDMRVVLGTRQLLAVAFNVPLPASTPPAPCRDLPQSPASAPMCWDPLLLPMKPRRACSSMAMKRSEMCC
jgi:formamidopyrimidine-DNA glycosylase